MDGALFDGVEQGGGRGLIKEGAGGTFEDDVDRAAGATGDHGEATGLRLGGDDAEIFDLRKEEEASAAIEVAEVVVGDASEEPDGGTGYFLEGVSLGARTRDEERVACGVGGVDGQVDALVRFEGGDDEPELLARDARIGRKEPGADGGIQDGRISLVAAIDLAARVGGVGEEGGHVARRGGVPGAESLGEEAQPDAAEHAAPGVLGFQRPHVASRSVAIANMRDEVWRAHALDGGGTRGEDEVDVLRGVGPGERGRELTHRERVEREEVASKRG